jgi:uncharacterized protein DUF4832/glycosyl hydrolase family 42 (putative beta-galactosidase)
MRRAAALVAVLLAAGPVWPQGPEVKIVRPQEIDDVLVNPGIGFTTFQRFNGDALNSGMGWTEGKPIEYQPFDGDLSNRDHPMTSIAYLRVNWRFVEPEEGRYAWDMLDRALDTAAERGQSLMLRISPYEQDIDVPDWYRQRVGPEKTNTKWRTDPENPLYAERFGRLIRRLGARYDGHPDLEAVDVAIVGYWGEGSGGHLLTEQTRKALLNAYLQGFRRTTLLFQPLNGDAPDPSFLVRGLPIAATWPDGTDNGSGPAMRHLGWRFDCLGDLGFWKDRVADWSHMRDVYPEQIIQSGMADAWRRAPVSLEICGTFLSWRDKQGYGEKEVRYIFDQALKWHVSSFNAKSSPVPAEWRPLVDDWLKRMGYRFVLRRFTYPARVRPHGALPFTSWWENKGVAPCYRDFRLALRFVGAQRTQVLVTGADMRSWLPGDSLYDDRVFLPADLPEGDYQLQVGLVDPNTRAPRVRLAIEGRDGEGWYPMGAITVQRGSFPVGVDRDLDTP